MIRVGIYIRLSDEDRVKRRDESESIINQKIFLTDYAIKQGWHIVDYYVDEDYSGADTNRSRPDFERLIKDAENKIFDVVLCKAQSRFTRDMEILERYVHNKFPEWGIRFISVVDNVDTNDKANKKSRQINGLVNEWYIEDLSNDIKQILNAKMEDGEVIASFAPYGYVKSSNDKNIYEVDEEAAEVVRLIFNLYLQGYGVQKICEILSEKGIDKPSIYMKKKGLKISVRSSKNNYWAATTVYRILKNEAYIGTLIQGRHTTTSYKNSKLKLKPKDEWVLVKEHHEPIIPKKDFYIVQDLLKNKRKVQKTNGNPDTAGRTHIFATKLRCMECGGSMVKTTAHGKDPQNTLYNYLRCKNYSKSHGAICSVSNRISYAELIDVVEEQFRKLIESYFDNKNAVEKTIGQLKFSNYSLKVNKLSNELINIDRKNDELNRALSNLYIDKLNSIVKEDEYVIISSTLKSDMEKLLQKRVNTIQEIEEIKSFIEKQDGVKDMLLKFKKDNKLTHQIVNEVIDYIEIGLQNDEKRDIIIHWKI